MKKTLSVLHRTLRVGNPKTVSFCFDGPAPIGKMIDQRNRRLRSKAKLDQPRVDSVAFTPGTLLMERLRDHLVHWSYRQMESSPQLESIYISGARCVGEGENKIFRRLPNNKEPCYIFGVDSDLLLYGLVHSKKNNITLVDLLIGPKTRVTNIGDHVEALRSSLPPQSDDSFIDDFAYLANLLGTDFIPGPISYDLFKAWSIYVEKKHENPDRNLMEKGIPNPAFLQQILMGVAANPPSIPAKKLLEDILGPIQMKPKIEMKQHEDVTMGMHEASVHIGNEITGMGRADHERAAIRSACLDILRSKKFYDLLRSRLKDEDESQMNRIYELLTDNGINVADSILKPEFLAYNRAKATDYLSALHWNYKYVEGTCLNYQYVYPYNSAPNLKTIAEATFDTYFKYDKFNLPPLVPNACALALIPPHAREKFLPPPALKLAQMEQNSNFWTFQNLFENLQRISEEVKSQAPKDPRERRQSGFSFDLPVRLQRQENGRINFQVESSQDEFQDVPQPFLKDHEQIFST
eukprot:TRINITY_DN876_c6_g1_i1.p1 TRINITY_DN876_c6_g1~~TRINITY_DN876_c6_g1_i1.p1  ORF type:complete len:594 (+),score=140.73 TRINITY_DN876_c6_g1_i1:219-1784(+)